MLEVVQYLRHIRRERKADPRDRRAHPHGRSADITWVQLRGEEIHQLEITLGAPAPHAEEECLKVLRAARDDEDEDQPCEEGAIPDSGAAAQEVDDH